MTTWWTSDLHIGHKNIIDFCGRPYADVPEMNNALRDNWNALVQPDDEVNIVGDVSMGDLTISVPFLASFNGVKVLWPGNHDAVHPVHRAYKHGEYRDYYEVDAGLIIAPLEGQVTIGDYEVTVCHFPFSEKMVYHHHRKVYERDKYSAYRPEDHGQWLICGHVHDAWKTKGRMINVGVDVWDYHPITSEQILEVIDQSWRSYGPE